jgi:hypothetical protein
VARGAGSGAHGEASLLAQSPDVLRKSDGEPAQILVNSAEAAQFLREKRDRAAHRQRMAKRGGGTLDFTRPAHCEAALDLVKAALAMPPIKPGFCVRRRGRGEGPAMMGSRGGSIAEAQAAALLALAEMLRDHKTFEDLRSELAALDARRDELVTVISTRGRSRLTSARALSPPARRSFGKRLMGWRLCLGERLLTIVGR